MWHRLSRVVESWRSGTGRRAVLGDDDDASRSCSLGGDLRPRFGDAKRECGLLSAAGASLRRLGVGRGKCFLVAAWW